MTPLLYQLSYPDMMKNNNILAFHKQELTCSAVPMHPYDNSTPWLKVIVWADFQYILLLLCIPKIQKKSQGVGLFLYLVAGARFARTPTGYEPVEVLLLQPAISLLYVFIQLLQHLYNLKLPEHSFVMRYDSLSFPLV